MTGIIGILILLFVMIVLQMPVGFSMAVVGFCGLWYVTGLNSALSMIGTETTLLKTITLQRCRVVIEVIYA
jgi:hypothetical protein